MTVKISGDAIQRLGPTVVAFTMPCGHVEKQDYSKGPIPKRMGAAGVDLMLRYWRRGGLYVNPKCKLCQKKGRKP